MSSETKIKTYPGEVFINRLYCEQCGAEMIRDEHMVLTTYPAQFSYTCPNCGKTMTSTHQYPEVFFRNKTEVEKC